MPKKDLLGAKKLDEIKNIKIKEHSEDVEFFIRFNCLEKKNINEKYVIEKLIKEGIRKELICQILKQNKFWKKH